MTNREVSPVWKNSTPVLIDEDTLSQAEAMIAACEACAPDIAAIPFDYVLDSITGRDPEITDYVLPKPARCPNCRNAVQAGYWRWEEEADADGRKVFILPGTLVSLKKE